MPEAGLLIAALSTYALAALLAGGACSISASVAARASKALLAVLGLAVLLHAGSLGARWASLGHGPFTTLHEILSSNLWSLALVAVLAAGSLRDVRVALPVAVPVLAVLAAWLVFSDPGAGHLPPTYATPLLYLHTLVGKLYLGTLLVAVALGLMPLLRRWRRGARPHGGLPDDRRFDELAHRFAAAALVFDSLMLIVGAVWAQDAWGRYWAWDPLESWAFLSWLALAAALHARATFRPAPAWFGGWLAVVFVLAFLTFFGVPFISTAPHKGAV
jgi:ABC-type transport system involved in cytochrome c biogenesis permease subunit